MKEIRIHDTIGSLMEDPETLRTCLELLKALQKLKIIVTVNGVSYGAPIRFSDGNAVIDVPIDTT